LTIIITSFIIKPTNQPLHYTSDQPIVFHTPTHIVTLTPTLISPNNQTITDLNENHDSQTEINYQINKENIKNIQIRIRVDKIQSLIDFYKNYDKDEFCPSTCAMLTIPCEVDAEINLLTQICELPGCKLTDNIKSSINQIYLIDDSIATYREISTVWNPNIPSCGLKLTGPDGYDAFIGNYTYKVAFIHNNYLIRVSSQFINSSNHNPDMINFLESLGYIDGLCDSTCLDKSYLYYKDYQLLKPHIESTINSLDQSVETLSIE